MGLSTFLIHKDMLYRMSHVSGLQKIYFLAKLRFGSKIASKREIISCKSRPRLVSPLLGTILWYNSATRNFISAFLFINYKNYLSKFLIFQDKLYILSWQQIHFVLFFMIFKASLLIQITNINQLSIDHFVR